MNDLAPVTPQEPPQLNLVALSPQDVPAAQQQLDSWCLTKLRALGSEYRMLRANLVIATKNRWSRGGIQRSVSRLKHEIQYYAKIRAAVKEGYLVVPNFDCEIMAVRIKAGMEPATNLREESSTYSQSVPQQPDVESDVIPVGTGEYVAQRPVVKGHTWTGSDPKTGEKKYFASSRAVGFALPDFPAVLVQPIVLDATARAMSLKIFDRIGVVTGRKKDPVVVGEIVHPKAKSQQRWSNDVRRVSFFIAWWLDTRSL